MTSVYDDIFYIETLEMMNERENKELDKENEINQEFVTKIIQYNFELKMFETLLNETLNELNQTSPCLESGKYHMLCLYANRYQKFIRIIKSCILRCELKIHKKTTFETWYCICMNYLNITYKNEEVSIKNLYQKKRD